MKPFSTFPLLHSGILVFLFLLLTTLFGRTTSQSSRNKSPELSITWSTCGYSEITVFLHQLVAKYSTISRLFSIGKSVEGRDLWVVVISDNPIERPLLRPQVKFVGNVLGNYGPSCYVLLRLITHLLKTFEYEDSMERRLVEMNEIHILPNMNPDGFMRSIAGACSGTYGRYNAAGYDLNRDFPDIFNPKEGKEMQPETLAIMNWIRENAFALSVSMMSGALVVTYPYDSVPTDTESPIHGPHLTPDDDIFKHLAMTYVKNVNDTQDQDMNMSSKMGRYCPAIKRNFGNGIVNGADWSPASGTMLDYNYAEGIFEIMVGVTCCRNENNLTVLGSVWDTNKHAMVEMIRETEYGVRGQVIDADTHLPIAGAPMVKLSHYKHLDDKVVPMPWRTTKQGEFWRLALPGKYSLQVRSEGYKEAIIPFEVKHNHFTTLIVELEKKIEPLPITEAAIKTDQQDVTPDVNAKSIDSMSLNVTHARLNVSENAAIVESSYSKHNNANLDTFIAAYFLIFLFVFAFVY